MAADAGAEQRARRGWRSRCCAGSPSRRTACARASAAGLAARRGAALGDLLRRGRGPSRCRAWRSMRPATRQRRSRRRRGRTRPGQQRAAVLVALADDPRRVGGAVERVAQRGLEERQLLLDDEDLLAGRAANARNASRVVRVEHPDLHQADAGALEVALVEPEVAQRLQQLVVGLAAGDDAQPGVARRDADGVELVERRRTGARSPGAGRTACARARATAGASRLPVRARGGRAGPRTRPSGITGHDALGPDLRGAGGVGDVGDDLQRAPQAADAREQAIACRPRSRTSCSVPG